LASDVDFTVELANGDDAWARALLFISQYTGEKVPNPRALGERRVIITSEGASADPFIYRVVRFISPRGYRFHVSCEPRLPGGDREVAERNARNVARFIKEGTLELSLLVR